MGIIKIPRATTTERENITPDAGDIIYDETLGEIYIGDGATAGGNQVAAGDLTVTDGTTTVPQTTQIQFIGATVSGSVPNAVVDISSGSGPENIPVAYISGGDGLTLGTVRVITASTYTADVANNSVTVLAGGVYEIRHFGSIVDSDTFSLTKRIFVNGTEVESQEVRVSTNTILAVSIPFIVSGIFTLNANDVISFNIGGTITNTIIKEIG